MAENANQMEILLDKVSSELRELKFDFYAKKTTDDVGLYVSYNPDKKQFVIVVCEKDNPEVAISIPVFLVSAEGKCRDVFDREFKEYKVYTDAQGGIQWEIVDSGEPKNVFRFSEEGKPQSIEGEYPRYYFALDFSVSSDFDALVTGEGGLITTGKLMVMAWDKDSLKRYVARILDGLIKADDAENAKEPEERYEL